MKIVISETQAKRDIDENKELVAWTNRDFLFYYAQKHQILTNTEFKIPKAAWVGFLSRIKGFRSTRHVGNFEYKSFIDDLFNIFYNKGYSPAFGSLVSIKLYNIVKSYRTKQYSNAEFEKLRNQLYNDSSLFKRLSESLADVVI